MRKHGGKPSAPTTEWLARHRTRQGDWGQGIKPRVKAIGSPEPTRELAMERLAERWAAHGWQDDEIGEVAQWQGGILLTIEALSPLEDPMARMVLSIREKAALGKSGKKAQGKNPGIEKADEKTERKKRMGL